MKLFSKKSRSGAIKADRAMIKQEEKRYISDRLELNLDVQKQKQIEEAKKMIANQLERQQGLPNRAKALKAFDETAKFFNKRVGELYNFKQQGGKVVGTLCVFAPPEIIMAAGAQHVRLCSGFHEPVFSANELLGEVGLCPLVRSTLGTKMVTSNPYFELCDFLVAPATCDGKMKLGEILSDYIPVLMLNVPRIKEGYVTHKSWFEEIKFFARKMESLTGNRITLKTLKLVIERYQRAQNAWHRLADLRRGSRVPIWGRDAMMVAQGTAYEDIDRWTKNLEQLNIELQNMIKNKQFVGNPDDPRIMLAGSPVIWPNWKIPNIVEESNAIIVADELCSAQRLFYDPVVVDEYTLSDMYRAIAERYLYPCTCPCFSPNNERSDILMNRLKAYKIDGVVFHVLKGCHLNSIESTRIDQLLRKNNIPMLKIESEYDEGDVEQIRTRVEAFLEIIRVRKEMKA
ncbi:double-cubane-cluster-containing anaerobic reductase [[Eubacterium] cellulosolvens]